MIRSARCYLNWTREALTRHSGVSLGAIKNIETGISRPNAETLEKLVRTLNAERDPVGAAQLKASLERCGSDRPYEPMNDQAPPEMEAAIVNLQDRVTPKPP